MFDLDPEARPSAAKCLTHLYLSCFADPSDEPELTPYDSTTEDESKDVDAWKS